MVSQIEHWFRLADEDRDGGVGGAEAVKFFTKSGLPQDVLGQIWEYSSGGGARLNMMQFGTAMRLVALAQASGNRLDPNQARMIAMGGGPQLPPPRLAGITGTPQPSIATYTPQITGLSPATSMAAGPTGGPYVPQPTGGYMPQVTGGPRPPIPGPYVQPQMTGMRPPVPAPYTEQATGPGATSGPPSSGFSAPGSGPPSAGYMGAMPVGAGATGVGLAAAAGPTGGFPGLPGFPPVTPADMQRYQTAFVQTDTDRDGLVKGSECFPVFMLSGLDKALLKRMWDMVAGNAGSLTAEQFFKCMYIMDGCRRGAQLPAVMPPGPWPQVTMPAAGGITGAVPAASMPITAGPTGSAPPSMPGSARTSAGGAPSMSGAALTAAPLPAENWSLENQFGPKGAQKAVADAYDQTLPKIPELPGKVTYDAQRPSISGLSTVPDLDTAVAGMLAPADKARWEAERQEALEKEQKQKEAEADAAAAKARVEAFQQALSELIMFKSRVDVALLQASDAAARLQNEAEETELRYNRARLAAQSQEEEGNAARQKLQALLARKQEAANKLELLQQELAMMQNLNPAELVALEKEVGKLVAEAAAAESKKAAMEMQLDSGKKQKSLLAERITDLEMAAAAGEGDIRRAREELEYLQAKVSGAQDSAMGGQLGEVGPLLSKAASAYRRLYSSAAAAGVEVPYEANLNNVGALVWLEQLMAGTADWVDDDSMVSGYTVVNALPDLEGVPPALLRAAALAAEQQPPIKPTAVIAAQKDKDASAAAGATPAAEGAVANGTAAAAAGAAPAAETGSPKAAGDTAIKGAAVAAIAAAAGEAAEEAETNEEVPAVAAGDASPSVEEEQSPAAEAVAPGGPDAAEVIDTFAVGPAADDTAAGFEDNVFGDNAFGDADAFPAAAEAAPTPAAAAAEETVPLQQQEHVAGDVLAVAEESAPLGSTAAAADVPAEAVGLGDAAETAVAAEELPTAVADLPPSASEAAVAVTDDVVLRKSLADEDDSDVGAASPFHPAAMSAVPAVAAASGGLGGGLPLSGFDPSMYRLNTDQQQLAHQNSVDSSVAGSYFGGSAVAGATGASASGFEDDAFGDHSGQQKEGQGAVMAFEDNAF